MAQVNPYLNFSGNCEEAFTFYRSVFGGEFSNVSRFSEMPEGAPTDSAEANWILHIALPIGDSMLMVSDCTASMGPTTAGDNVHVTVSPDSAEDSERIFNALAEGGQVTMPYEKQFWGDYFGMCTDRYGINWMVDYAEGDQG